MWNSSLSATERAWPEGVSLLGVLTDMFKRCMCRRRLVVALEPRARFEHFKSRVSGFS